MLLCHIPSENCQRLKSLTLVPLAGPRAAMSERARLVLNRGVLWLCPVRLAVLAVPFGTGESFACIAQVVSVVNMTRYRHKHDATAQQ
jgi:hypothetical protein